MALPNTFTFTGTVTSAPFPLPGHTICEVIEEIGRALGLLERTATGGTSNSIIDANLTRYGNDYWINSFAYIKTSTDAATPQGEESFVTDFVAATGALTVNPAFTTVVDTGDVYQLYQHLPRSDIKIAVMRAVAGVEVATSLVPRDDTLDYVLNCTGLYRRQQLLGVFVRSQNDVEVMPDQIKGWWLEDAEGLLTLRMPYLLNEDDGFWITYHMGEGEVWPEDYHVNAPLGLLQARGVVYCLKTILAGQDLAGLEKFGRLLTFWKGELQEEERKYQRPSRKVRSFPWYTQEAGDGNYSETRLGLIA